MTSAIILAGGMGTRLRSVVSDRPKPMALIGNTPFLERQMIYWLGQGINHFILSVGYKFEIIQNYFGDNFRNVPIDYAIESSPLGTGGGLMHSLQFLKNDEPFVVLNGDTYFSISLSKLQEAYRNHHSDWCLALFNNNDKKRYLGISVDVNHQIQAFKAENLKDQWVNGGVYLLTQEPLKKLNLKLTDKISIEENIFPMALALGQKMIGIEFEETFIDIGIPEDFLRAQTILEY